MIYKTFYKNSKFVVIIVLLSIILFSFCAYSAYRNVYVSISVGAQLAECLRYRDVIRCDKLELGDKDWWGNNYVFIRRVYKDNTTYAVISKGFDGVLSEDDFYAEEVEYNKVN